MNQPVVTAEWAWISKEPGARVDYQVLAASGGAFESGNFTGDYVAGVPDSSTPEGSPAQPPWVTFGGHGGPERRVLSLSVLDPWQGQDQSGRRIWPRRFFLCPYEQVADAGASYQALWEAMREVTLSTRDHAPLSLVPHSADLGTLRRVIEGIGVERVAAIAAALLDNPVAVTGAASLYLDGKRGELSRIAVLDAVAALLPYGFRADLSASTEVSKAVAYEMRLVFTDSAKRSHQPRTLQGPAIVPESPRARQYFDMLRKRISRPGDLDTVLKYLWNKREARSFARAWDAVDDLANMDRDSYEIEAVIEGEESIETSLHILHGPSADVERKWLDHRLNDHRPKVVRPLLYPPDARALQPLQSYWNIIESEVIAVVNQWLDQDQADRVLGSLSIASSLPLPDNADRLLMMLLVPPDMAQLHADQNPDWQRRFRARVALLRQVNAPSPGTFPKTCELLRAGQAQNWQGQLVKDVLFHDLATHPEHGLDVARWLCLSEVQVGWQDWALALRRMIAPDSGRVDADVVRSVLRQDDHWAVTAFGLAAVARHVPEALQMPGLAVDLVGLAGRVGQGDGANELRRVLAPVTAVPLSARHLGNEVAAKVDIARLFLNQAPEFPYGADEVTFSGYHQKLLEAFSLRAVTESGVDVESRYLRVVMDNRPPGRQLPPGVISMLRSWSQQAQLVARVARYAAQPDITPLLMADTQLEDEFWAPLVRYESTLNRVAAVPVLRGAVRRAIARPRETLDRFADPEAGVSGAQLTLAMYRALRSMMTPGEILAVMIGVTVDHRDLTQAITPIQLYDVFCQLESMLANPARDTAPAGNARRAAVEIFIQFIARICDGAWGVPFASEFKREVPRRLDSDISARKELKKIITGPPWYWPFGGRRAQYPPDPGLATGMSPGHQEGHSRPPEPAPRVLAAGSWGPQDPGVTQPSRPDPRGDAHRGDGPAGDGPARQAGQGKRRRLFGRADSAGSSDQRAGVPS